MLYITESCVRITILILFWKPIQFRRNVCRYHMQKHCHESKMAQSEWHFSLWSSLVLTMGYLKFLSPGHKYIISKEMIYMSLHCPAVGSPMPPWHYQQGNHTWLWTETANYNFVPQRVFTNHKASKAIYSHIVAVLTIASLQLIVPCMPVLTGHIVHAQKQ